MVKRIAFGVLVIVAGVAIFAAAVCGAAAVLLLVFVIQDQLR